MTGPRLMLVEGLCALEMLVGGSWFVSDGSN